MKYLPNPFTTGRTQRKVNFYQLPDASNSEFFFFLTGCHTKVKEPSLSYFLPIAGGRIVGSLLSQVYQRYVKCKQIHPVFELGSLGLFPTTITDTMQQYQCRGSCRSDKKQIGFITIWWLWTGHWVAGRWGNLWGSKSCFRFSQARIEKVCSCNLWIQKKIKTQRFTGGAKTERPRTD